MIFSNGIAILGRFFSFNFTGALIAVYGVFFGFIVTMLEAPGPFCCKHKVHDSIRFYAKFLEFTWGRGAFYMFCGSLQVSNWNILDWAVGGFMIFVGITALGVGIATARDLKLFKFSVKSEEDLKGKWAKYDEDSNGTLDCKELTKFIKDAGIDMSRNEVAATFLALDRNFDDVISYEEFYSWWIADDAYGTRGISMSV